MKLRNWYAVYALLETVPSAEQLTASLRPVVAGLSVELKAAGETWHQAEIRIAGAPYPIVVMSRRDWSSPDFSAKNWTSDSIPAQWDEPNRAAVMEHLGRCRQEFSLQGWEFQAHLIGIGGAKLARICEQLCGGLARRTNGLIQVYQEGFFNVAGESLLPRNPKHRLKTS